MLLIAILANLLSPYSTYVRAEDWPPAGNTIISDKVVNYGNIDKPNTEGHLGLTNATLNAASIRLPKFTLESTKSSIHTQGYFLIGNLGIGDTTITTGNYFHTADNQLLLMENSSIIADNYVDVGITIDGASPVPDAPELQHNNSVIRAKTGGILFSGGIHVYSGNSQLIADQGTIYDFGSGMRCEDNATLAIKADDMVFAQLIDATSLEAPNTIVSNLLLRNGNFKLTDATSVISDSIVLENMTSEIGGINDPELGYDYYPQSVTVSGGTLKGDKLYFGEKTVFKDNAVADIGKLAIHGELDIESGARLTVKDPDFGSNLINMDKGSLFLEKDISFARLQMRNESLLQNEGAITINQPDFELSGSRIKSSSGISLPDFSASGENRIEAGGDFTSGTLKINSGASGIFADGNIKMGSISAEKGSNLQISAPKGQARTGAIKASGLTIDSPSFEVSGDLDLEAGNFSASQGNAVSIRGNAKLLSMKSALDQFVVIGSANINGGSFTARQMNVGGDAKFENLLANASTLEIGGSLNIENAILRAAELRNNDITIRKGVLDLLNAASLSKLAIKDGYLHGEGNLDLQQKDILIDNSVLDSEKSLTLQNARAQGNAYIRGVEGVKLGSASVLSDFTNIISENGNITGETFNISSGARLGLYAPQGEISSDKINASIVDAKKLSVNGDFGLANGYLRLTDDSSVGGNLNLNRVDSVTGDLAVSGTALIHGGAFRGKDISIDGQTEIDNLNADFASFSVNDMLILESGVIKSSDTINLGSLRAYDNNWLLADKKIAIGQTASIFSGETSIYSSSSNIEGKSFSQWNSGKLGLYAPKGRISADVVQAETVSAGGVDIENDLAISSGNLRLTEDKQSHVGRNLNLHNTNATFKNLSVGANAIIENGSTKFGSLTVGDASYFNGGDIAGYEYLPAQEAIFYNSAKAGINILSGKGNVFVTDASWLAANEIDLNGASLVLSGSAKAKSRASAEKMENTNLFVGANSMFMSGMGGQEQQETAHNALGVSASLGLWKPLVLGPGGGSVGSTASRQGGQINFGNDSLVIASAYSGLQPQGAISATTPMDANVSEASKLHIAQAEKNGLYRILGENLNVNYSGDAWKNPTTDSLLYKLERLEGNKLGWFRVVDNDLPVTPEGRPPLDEGGSNGSITPVIPSTPSTPVTPVNPPAQGTPSNPSTPVTPGTSTAPTTPSTPPSIPSSPNIPASPITPPAPPTGPVDEPEFVTPIVPTPPAQLPVPEPAPAPDDKPDFPDNPSTTPPADTPSQDPDQKPDPSLPSEPENKPGTGTGEGTNTPSEEVPDLPPPLIPEPIGGTNQWLAPGQIFISNALNFWLMGNDPWLAGITIESAERLVSLGAVPQMALATREAISEIIMDRAANKLNSNIESAELTDHIALWISPLYSSRLGFGLDAGIHDLDYKGNFGGMVMGSDWSHTTSDFSARLGIAAGIGAGYARSFGDLAKTENNFNFWGLAAYGSLGIGNFGINANIGFTSLYNELEQEVPDGMRLPNLKSDVTSQATGFELNANYRFMTDWLDISPHVGARYTYINVDNYAAYSNGCVLEGDSMSQSVWAFPVGLTLEKTFQTSSGYLIKPVLNLEATPSVGDLNSESTVRFTGINSAASLDAQIIDAITYGGSAGLFVEKGDFTLGLSYNAQFGEHTTKQSIFGVFKWEF